MKMGGTSMLAQLIDVRVRAVAAHNRLAVLAAIKMTHPLFQDGFVRPLIISGLAAILTGCAGPRQVYQASPQPSQDQRLARTEKSIAASKSNPRHRNLANRYTVNATPTNVPKIDVSSPVQPNNCSGIVRNLILTSLEKRQTMV